MSKRAAVYGRVSTDLQRDNYSIPTQIAECIRYGEKRGYPIVGDRFVDPETGVDIVNENGAVAAYVDDLSSRELSRPGLNAAIDYLETSGFDVLIVHSIDRLARDPYIRQTLENELMERGARVEYVLGNYEDTPEGDVRKDLDATFAKWENAKRVERCNRGKRRKAESGLFVTGKAPYGYKWDEDSPSGLSVDEKQAEVIRWMFDLYVNESLSIRGVISRLEEENILTHSGNKKWAPTSVNRILRNTAYLGKLYYNKTKLLPGNRREKRPPNEWIEIPVTPIVDDWIFEEAQKRFKENRERRRRHPKRFYLLAGMVVCDNCGKSYLGQTYKKGKQRRATDRQIYRHRMKVGHCQNKSIKAEILEEIVWEEVVAILKDPQRLRAGYEESLEQHKARYARHQAHIDALRKKAEKLEVERENLVAAYIDPEIPLRKDVYIEQMMKIEDELDIISKQLDEWQMEVISIPTPAELESLEAFSGQICQNLDTINPSPQEKRQLFELLHIKVIVTLDGYLRLEGWFTPLEVDGQLYPPSPCRATHRRCPLRLRSPPHPTPGRRKKTRAQA